MLASSNCLLPLGTDLIPVQVVLGQALGPELLDTPKLVLGEVSSIESSESFVKNSLHNRLCDSGCLQLFNDSFFREKHGFEGFGLLFANSFW